MNSLELGDETISKRAQVCLDLYEECHAICVGLDNRLGGKASEEDNHCNDGEAPIASLVENQLGRFNIWTSNIGFYDYSTLFSETFSSYFMFSIVRILCQPRMITVKGRRPQLRYC